MSQVITKYDGAFDFEIYREDMIKSIFKILPLKEEGKDWERYLDGVLVEFNGMDMLLSQVNLLAVMGKLEGLKVVEEHEMFRKIIFDSINLVKKIIIE